MRRWGGVVGIASAVAISLAMGSVASGDTQPPPWPTAECTVGGSQGQCGTGWYTAPVSLIWALHGETTVAGCASQNYTRDTNDSGIPAPQLPAWEYCTWSDPTGTYSGTVSYRMKMELSSPTATGVPARAPDAGGWYNHPIGVSFAASAFSGIASCTAPQTYGGPDSSGAALTGICTDNAGKTAPASFSLQYDATPPTLAAAVDPGDGSVNLSWQAASAPAPLSSITVTRTPGEHAAAASVLYQGAANALYDSAVRNGSHYTYTITAADQAGNVTVRDVVATPGPRLLSPAPGAHTGTPPLLTWTPVPKARYYNVQLYRGGKILSRWPTGASLQLPRTWRFDGRRHRLRPGRYRWYVWPGFGARKAARYGHMVGTATFVVT